MIISVLIPVRIIVKSDQENVHLITNNSPVRSIDGGKPKLGWLIVIMLLIRGRIVVGLVLEALFD